MCGGGFKLKIKTGSREPEGDAFRATIAEVLAKRHEC